PTLNLNVYFLPVKQPHQEKPQQNEANRVGERSVNRLSERQEDVVEYPALERYVLSIGAGKLDQAHDASHQTGADEKGKRVDAEDDERFGPRAVALAIDQPLRES